MHGQTFANPKYDKEIYAKISQNKTSENQRQIENLKRQRKKITFERKTDWIDLTKKIQSRNMEFCRKSSCKPLILYITKIFFKNESRIDISDI